MIGQISLFEILGTDDLDVDLNEITEEDPQGFPPNI